MDILNFKLKDTNQRNYPDENVPEQYFTSTLIGQIGVGTPKKQYRMFVDFDSIDFWLINKEEDVYVTTDSSDQHSDMQPLTDSDRLRIKEYSSLDSSTYNGNRNFYHDQFKSVEGVVAFDDICIRGSRFKQVVFGLVCKLSDWILKFPVDGMLDENVPEQYFTSTLIGQIGVGTPKKQYRMFVDFDSIDFWLINKEEDVYVTTDSSDQHSDMRPLTDSDRLRIKEYSSLDSSTYNGNRNFYHDQFKSVEGVVAFDDICIRGSRFKQVVFGLVCKLSDWILKFPVDGMLGFAVTGNEGSKLSLTDRNYTLEAFGNELDRAIMCLWLQGEQFMTQDTVGVLKFGELDVENCSHTWNFVPLLTHDSNLQFVLSAVIIDQIEIPVDSPVIIDTKQMFIRGPVNDIERMIAELGAIFLKKINGADHYSISCDTSDLPTISFSIGEHSVILEPEDYVLQEFNKRQCTLAFTSLNNGDREYNWYLGTAFLTANCMAVDFDQHTIGFASSKQDD
uniref:Peptidase A1 domain-containing protein n=1 Tax=Ditylenchus dipsaci TaxID=166011 RepID=A0A915E773_9BILA